MYISGILSLVNFIQFLIMNEDKFNSKYNPEFSFYSQFNITDVTGELDMNDPINGMMNEDWCPPKTYEEEVLTGILTNKKL